MRECGGHAPGGLRRHAIMNDGIDKKMPRQLARPVFREEVIPSKDDLCPDSI